MTEEYVLRCVLMLCCALLTANASVVTAAAQGRRVQAGHLSCQSARRESLRGGKPVSSVRDASTDSSSFSWCAQGQKDGRQRLFVITLLLLLLLFLLLPCSNWFCCTCTLLQGCRKDISFKAFEWAECLLFKHFTLGREQWVQVWTTCAAVNGEQGMRQKSNRHVEKTKCDHRRDKLRLTGKHNRVAESRELAVWGQQRRPCLKGLMLRGGNNGCEQLIVFLNVPCCFSWMLWLGVAPHKSRMCLGIIEFSSDSKERRAGVVGVEKLWLAVIEEIFDVMAGSLDEAFDLNVTSHEIAEQTPPWGQHGDNRGPSGSSGEPQQAQWLEVSTAEGGSGEEEG
ncbi:hypothetical protein EYF80_011147 [Liparis tanakae]|uniref:Uncharacterized protein n=1 Tax=Liparis tanakae TaxID=230148 RepID=A0A4Z2IMV8_9TELE|nr:hypothetical protein EYF80_011147 [Liparis tanakae]